MSLLLTEANKHSSDDTNAFGGASGPWPSRSLADSWRSGLVTRSGRRPDSQTLALATGCRAVRRRRSEAVEEIACGLTCAILASLGGVAAVAGFGIGSLLTPAFALQMDARLAVAAVSIPHAVGTAFRFWLLGARVDRGILWSFGLTSAAGGLVGALLQSRAGVPALMALFGGLLLFTAGAELSGLARRMRFDGAVAWAVGGTSGLLGGLVGNQGGIRSAALLGVDLQKHVFVGTATAVGLMVDAARMPVYLWQLHEPLSGVAGWIGLATVGVVVGTLLGHRLLVRIPERVFRRTVAVVLARSWARQCWLVEYWPHNLRSVAFEVEGFFAEVGEGPRRVLWSPQRALATEIKNVFP